MPIKREQLSPTTTKLTITADASDIAEAKDRVLKRLGQEVKIPGFRPGKAPATLVEKHLDANLLQSEFLDEAVNRLYSDAVTRENLRPVVHPTVSVQKFVPFTTLEFVAEVETIGDVTLPDYKKLRLAKKQVTISDKEVEDVIQNLQRRLAEKIDVKRAAKDGDELTIDFTGKDAKTNEPVKGADDKGYPLLLGSNTFIPGFESNLIGLKAGEQKTFTLAFPKDYGVAALQNRKITFEVTVAKVQELKLPKVDDAFAAKVGPFKTVKELREDIRRQLTTEKQAETDRVYENELLDKLAAGSTIALPKVLIDEEVERAEQQLRQNLTYRNQTWQEYLESLGQSEEQYRTSLRDPAEQRVKAGLALTEVADREQIMVTPEELQLHMQLLKGQYKDPAMQAELDKPENMRTIMSSLLSDKTIARLTEYATAPVKKTK